MMAGESYNLFEAAFKLHDRSLHSTISTLQNSFGIKVSRVYEYVPGFEGNKTRCRRYWIDAKERLRIKYEIYAAKEKALTKSDESKGVGLDFSPSADSAGGDEEPDSLLTKPLNYVRNCLKAIARF